MDTKFLKVAPITKGISKELSYFTSKKDIRPGSLITIPIRKKEQPALVLEVKDVKIAKSQLRNSSYPLKRILDIKHPSFFTPKFIKAAEKTARYFFCGTGTVIKKFCPQVILEKPPIVEKENQQAEQTIEENETRPLKTKGEIQILRAPQKERIKFYKNTIRTSFAKKESIFICLPSVKEIEHYENELKKGIEQFTISLSSQMGKKETREKWTKLQTENHPLLIISTALFLSAPRKDLKTFILENEGSPFYKSQRMPFINIKTAIKNLNQETKGLLILGDEIVKTETYYENKTNKTPLAAPVSDKITGYCQSILVDLKKQNSIISDELKEMLAAAYKNNERCLLFINRRGYGLSTVCNDCKKIISCPQCDTPLVLHQENGRKFICHKCMSQITAGNNCPYCKGYNLKTLGYGIQKINEQIADLFPDFKIFMLDSDTAKTKKQAQEIIKKYEQTAGSILLATEIFFSHYNEEVERTGVVSVDGLFNLPDFRINERIFRLLLKLKTMTSKTFLVQSRIPEHSLFKHILNGDISGFYESELKSRKLFGYPPFKTLIKITREGKNKEQIQKEMKTLEKKLEDYEIAVFPAFTGKTKNLYRFYLLIKKNNSEWPPEQNNRYPNEPDKNQKLYNILASLSPQWKIDVEPESLL